MLINDNWHLALACSTWLAEIFYQCGQLHFSRKKNYHSQSQILNSQGQEKKTKKKQMWCEWEWMIFFLTVTGYFLLYSCWMISAILNFRIRWFDIQKMSTSEKWKVTSVKCSVNCRWLIDSTNLKILGKCVLEISFLHSNLFFVYCICS